MAVEPLKTKRTYFEQDSIKRKIVNEIKPVKQYEKKKDSVNINEFMNTIINKIDNINSNPNNVYGEQNISAVDVDIKREIAISNVDQNAVKSEVTHGRVKTKKDKLRELRKRR